MEKLCDLSKGDTQCPYDYRYPNGIILYCVLVAGHEGNHQIGYIDQPTDQSLWRRGPTRPSHPLVIGARLTDSR